MKVRAESVGEELREFKEFEEFQEFQEFRVGAQLKVEEWA